MKFTEWKKKYKPIFGGADRSSNDDPKRVWCVCDGGEGYYILNGYHCINVLEEFITEIPLENESDSYLGITEKQYYKLYYIIYGM